MSEFSRKDVLNHVKALLTIMYSWFHVMIILSCIYKLTQPCVENAFESKSQMPRGEKAQMERNYAM